MGMKAFIAASFIALAITAFSVHQFYGQEPSQKYADRLNAIADQVNSLNTTWKAGRNLKWENQTEESITNFMMPLGTKTVDEGNEQFFHSEETIQAAPESFDSREQWPNCESIKEIRDQSSCGSCWAFGASETMSDRICIHSGQKDQTRVSAEDLLECCWMCGMGCNGGNPGSAFFWWRHFGLATGGLYGDQKYCKAYKFAPCGHHVKSEKYPDCPSTEYKTPSCKRECTNGDDYKGSKVYASRVYSVSGESQMMTEISTNGSVAVAFTVYEDFPTYKSGVYQHVTGSALGGHAVKAIGYGVENGTKYWLIANSWNETWGDQGFFKILRGSNHCGIEDSANAGVPRS